MYCEHEGMRLLRALLPWIAPSGGSQLLVMRTLKQLHGGKVKPPASNQHQLARHGHHPESK